MRSSHGSDNNDDGNGNDWHSRSDSQSSIADCSACNAPPTEGEVYFYYDDDDDSPNNAPPGPNSCVSYEKDHGNNRHTKLNYNVTLNPRVVVLESQPTLSKMKMTPKHLLLKYNSAQDAQKMATRFHVGSPISIHPNWGFSAHIRVATKKPRVLDDVLYIHTRNGTLGDMFQHAHLFDSSNGTDNGSSPAQSTPAPAAVTTGPGARRGRRSVQSELMAVYNWFKVGVDQ